ncbi:MAG: response regulator [Aphanocapsa lilacina HA4352-LM1]|jgi:PAS domain S-box-containing protein|nr:response regulator [Aphanocapsa lilacina HA4352-LM1]
MAAIKILLVEDNPGDMRLLREILKDAPAERFEWHEAGRLQEAVAALAHEHFDVVLLDLSLPDSRGLDSLIALKPFAAALPIVVLTGFEDETLATGAMQLGAQDYLVKGQVTGSLLVRSIRYAIERQRAEQKIHEQAALLDVATDAILLRDLDNRVVFWNKGAERLYGWSAAQVLGQTAADLLYGHGLAGADEARLVAEEVFATVVVRGEWQGELTKFTRSGKKLIAQSRWTLVRDEQGRPKSILTVDTDITEKKQLEAKFLRAQRLESLGTLAGGIAHDLNNILTPIVAAAQLLPLRLTDLDQQDLRLLRMLEENSRRGSHLVTQILSFARGMEGRRTILQIRHLLGEVGQIVRQTFPKSIEIRIDASAQDLWTIQADATQMHQVLMNLCVNARDAMPGGGLLTLTARNLIVDEHYARLIPDAVAGAYVVVTVGDTGTGITPEIIEKIFEPFFTTKELGKGTGLGLSTVLGIVKHHGGFVGVYSEPGRGTEFRVHLPAAAESAVEPEAQAELPEGCGELVLVVDDEAAILEVIRTALESHNYRVVGACNGLEAIVAVSRHRGAVRAVLMDMMMPAMDGPAAIFALQDIDPYLPVVAMSGIAHAERPRAHHPDLRAFLTKPFTLPELLLAIHTAIHGRSAA